MAELLFGVARKFNTIEFVLLEGGDESFRKGRTGVIQDFWVKGCDCWHPAVKFSIWTKSRQRSKSITLDICYIGGDRPPTAKEVKRAVRIFKEELSRKGWLFRRARWERNLISCAESDWRSTDW